MKKKEFLNDENIREFSEWLSRRLESDELSHGWTNRKSGARLQFNSLIDAYKQFEWPFKCTLPDGQNLEGKSRESNEATLDRLSVLLRGALTEEDESLVLKCCISIIKWGGVTARNQKWLEKNASSLVGYLRRLKDTILSERTDFTWPDLRFNSGMSKICSLMVDDFIIYDSRVAAALGMLITRYCTASGLSAVPGNLRFPRMSAKEAPDQENPKNRNPSTGSYVFPLMQRGAPYLRANMKASWLLDETLKRAPNSEFNELNNPLNALGSALFMYGYDLGSMKSSIKQTARRSKRPEKPPAGKRPPKASKNAGYPFETRGWKRKVFRAEYHDRTKTIILRNKEGREDPFPI